MLNYKLVFYIWTLLGVKCVVPPTLQNINVEAIVQFSMVHYDS